MKIFELIRIAFSSIASNKLRSLLTMLGLIIGISSVVTIITIGQGSQKSIESNLDSLGINKVTIYYEKDSPILPSEKFTINDINGIRESFSQDILGISPISNTSGTIIGDIDDRSISISGTNEDLRYIENLELVSGRYFIKEDVSARKNVIIIDSELSNNLFGTSNSAGEKIIINTGSKSAQFFILAVYEKEDNMLNFSDARAYMPYTTIDKIYNFKGRIGGLTVAISDELKSEETADRIISYLHRKHGILAEDKYRSFSLGSQIEMVTDVMGQITLLISAIAGISLVVGGIGVMNIMLVSVTERTREIGIRKALGAKRLDILIQFLIEAVSICVLGGAIGIGFGFVFVNIAENLMSIEMTLSLESIILATLFSSVIGIIFGVYPANKASKLDPIEALRYE